jgi:UDP-N-acetylmuramoyl-tripeptide--D-alanyl-D-alanine ligase
MESISINEIVSWTGARLLLGKKENSITSFSTDSRTIAKNDFFVPITGENFNGADYIIEAVRKNASGFVYSRGQKNINDVLMVVKNEYPGVVALESGNTVDFFKETARGYLKQFNIISLGVTGSAGKTTTKNFIVSILEKTNEAVFSKKNFNNEIGIPKTIFEVNRNTKYLIVELGMRAKGQIADLAQICNLKYGIITGIGPSHLEFFKNVEEIALAKAEIAEMIYKNNGVLFLNGDDNYTGLIKNNVKCDSVLCGSGYNFEYNFSNCKCDQNALYNFDLNMLDKNIFHINLNIPGYHNIYNSVLAAGLSLHLGIDPSIVKKSINETTPESLRMEIIEKNGKVILNDCYNANPLSVKSAIDSLAVISGKRKMRSVAILGDMLELVWKLKSCMRK